MSRIEIPLSKSKITLVVIGALGFVILGILFVITPDTFVSPIFRNPQILRVIGVASILFFGAVGMYGVRKWFDTTIGLIIDENGITDNTNAASVGLIEWADILDVETERVMSTRFLLIFTADPDKYLNRVSGFKRKLMQGNMKMYGTPLAITSNTVKCDFDDLEKLITSKLAEHQQEMFNL